MLFDLHKIPRYILALQISAINPKVTGYRSVGVAYTKTYHNSVIVRKNCFFGGIDGSWIVLSAHTTEL